MIYKNSIFEVLPSLEYTHHKTQQSIGLMKETFDNNIFEYNQKKKFLNTPGKFKHNNTLVPIMVVNVEESGWKYLKLRQSLQPNTTQYDIQNLRKAKLNVNKTPVCPVKTRSISLLTISDLIDNSRKTSLDPDISLMQKKQLKLEMDQFHSRQLQLIRNKFKNLKYRRDSRERQNQVNNLNLQTKIPELRTFKLTPEPRAKV